MLACDASAKITPRITSSFDCNVSEKCDFVDGIHLGGMPACPQRRSVPFISCSARVFIPGADFFFPSPFGWLVPGGESGKARASAKICLVYYTSTPLIRKRGQVNKALSK